MKQITMADQERGTHSCHIEHSVRPNKGSSKGTFQGRIATQPESMCRRMVTVSSTMRIPNMKRGGIQPSSFLPHSLVGSVLIIPLVNKRKQIANLESEQQTRKLGTPPSISQTRYYFRNRFITMTRRACQKATEDTSTSLRLCTLVLQELGFELDGAHKGLALENLGDVLGLGDNVVASHLELLEELIGRG